jgi:hypothetical protein
MPDRNPMSQMMSALAVREGIQREGSPTRSPRPTAVDPLIDGEVGACGRKSMSTSKSSIEISVGSASNAECCTSQG